MNIGNGDPSGIADGDLKRVGSDLFIRNGGAWQSVGGGGVKTANGQVGSSGGAITVAPAGFTNGGGILLESNIRNGSTMSASTNAGQVSVTGSIGGNNDSPSTGVWVAIGNI